MRLELVSWRSPTLTCSIRYCSDCWSTHETSTAAFLFRTLTFFGNIFFISLGFVPNSLSSALKILSPFSIKTKNTEIQLALQSPHFFFYLRGIIYWSLLKLNCRIVLNIFCITVWSFFAPFKIYYCFDYH